MSVSVGDCRTRDDLCAALEKGAQAKFVFFWGHQPSRPGEVDQACLSQWAPLGFDVDGVSYATAEHYMMASKARLFGDVEVLAQILACEEPGHAKKLGRQVRGFKDEVWKANRFEAVVEGNVAKFGQSEALRDYLLGTGSRVLVEASPRDRIWGIGLGRNNPRASQPAQWRGLNLLGFALMEARARLGARA